MNINLRPEQIDAVNKMHNGCILCGDVGSGKSRTALAYYYKQNGGDLTQENYPMDDPPRDLYIITTAHKRDLFEWDDEMLPFHLGTKPERNIYDNNVVVDSWNNIQKYRKVIGAFFIFDEQRVVGRGAWVKAFLDIARKNQWILLSATPGDTWSDYIPVFVANGFYRNRTDFLEQHAVWDRYCRSYPKIKSYYDTGRLIRYRKQLLVDICVNKPAEQHHEFINVNYDKTQYLRMTKERWNIWEDKPIENPAEYCLALRRIVNTSDSRQIAVLELFEQHPKLIIFYNFDYELELLKYIFSNHYNGVVVREWNGHKHEPIPETGSWVYLVQYTAGCEGWNCIETDTMVFYSLNYSYRIMKQASGRTDRLNTPFKDLYYYYLSSQSGIDLAIRRSLKMKKDFNANKYAGGYFDGNVKKITKISNQTYYSMDRK